MIPNQSLNKKSYTLPSCRVSKQEYEIYKSCAKEFSLTHSETIRWMISFYKQNKEKIKKRKVEKIDEIDEKFELFWSSYPRKSAKKNTKKLWDSMKLSKNEDNFQKIIQHCQYAYTDREERFIPLPTTYLHGERWNDEDKSKEIKPLCDYDLNIINVDA